MRTKGTKTIAENRQARHEYFVLESFEAGIELTGTEVKSIRQGAVNLKDSWCSIEGGEMFIKQQSKPMTMARTREMTDSSMVRPRPSKSSGIDSFNKSI